MLIKVRLIFIRSCTEQEFKNRKSGGLIDGDKNFCNSVFKPYKETKSWYTIPVQLFLNL